MGSRPWTSRIPCLIEGSFRVFFADEFGERMCEDPDLADNPWFSPRVRVSSEKLDEAVSQVEMFATWFEERAFAAKYSHLRR
jgi:hypothetical protein